MVAAHVRKSQVNGVFGERGVGTQHKAMIAINGGHSIPSMFYASRDEFVRCSLNTSVDCADVHLKGNPIYLQAFVCRRC